MRKFLILFPLILMVFLFVFVFTNKTAEAPEQTTTPSVSGSVSPSATPDKEANITVTSPKAGDQVSGVITVTGKARVFENTFNYVLRDANNKKLFESYGMTEAQDSGIFGKYTVKMVVPAGATKDLFVEVFEYSAKDGEVINLVRVPVTLASQETIKVKAYFNNNTLDPEFTCTTSFPVERDIMKTTEVAYSAVSELLKGPSVADKKAGYYSSLPANVHINSLVVRYGTAYIDFDGSLENEVGGSCRVGAIRSQIENTLKQFPTIKKVVISIYGRIDDILQP